MKKLCFLGPEFPISSTKDVSLPPGVRRFISCFQGDGKEGQSVLVLTASQVTFIPNNQYAKGACFGVADFLPLHLLAL